MEGAVGDEVWRPRAFSTVKIRRREWVWKPWIPLRSIGMVAGDPGSGKSTVVYDLVARLSRGATMPNGWSPPEPTNILMVPLEAEVELDIAPRLQFMEADMNRVHFIPQEHISRYPADIPKLETSINQVKAKLIVIDPMMKAIQATESLNDNQKISQVMALLEALVKRTNSTILLIHHLNKGQGSKALYRANGAISIVGSVRYSLAVGTIPGEAPIRAITWFKGNVSAPELCPAMAFEIYASKDDEFITGTRWLGDRPELTADDLYGGMEQVVSRAIRRAPPKSRVQLWLDEYFDRVGVIPQDPETIYQEGMEFGFTKSQISSARTKSDIEVVASISKLGRRNYWQRKK